MWYINKDYILIHQTYVIALTWHYFVEFMKNMPCGNSKLMLHMTFISSRQPDVGRVFLHVSNVFLCLLRSYNRHITRFMWSISRSLQDRFIGIEILVWLPQSIPVKWSWSIWVKRIPKHKKTPHNPKLRYIPWNVPCIHAHKYHHHNYQDAAVHPT